MLVPRAPRRRTSQQSRSSSPTPGDRFATAPCRGQTPASCLPPALQGLKHVRVVAHHRWPLMHPLRPLGEIRMSCRIDGETEKGRCHHVRGDGDVGKRIRPAEVGVRTERLLEHPVDAVDVASSGVVHLGMALPTAELDDGNGVGRRIELRVRDLLEQTAFRSLLRVGRVEPRSG